jgi:hypothetical protein
MGVFVGWTRCSRKRPRLEGDSTRLEVELMCRAIESLTTQMLGTISQWLKYRHGERFL